MASEETPEGPVRGGINPHCTEEEKERWRKHRARKIYDKRVSEDTIRKIIELTEERSSISEIMNETGASHFKVTEIRADLIRQRPET
jgi:nitroreductase